MSDASPKSGSGPLGCSGRKPCGTPPASDYGQVDGRYGGEVVCAFTDGSVRSLSIAELRDMQLWNRNAAAQNNPDYTVKHNGPDGGRL